MIGEKLGPFRIEEKLGSGAMGVVYRAIHEPTGQSVAVKIVAGETASRGNAAERFERESDILKQFKHPNIVQHIGTGFSKSRELRFYAMEYVPGVTLDQVLAERGALPWREVVDLGLQLCEALQYAHERGVVHRDLKPSNLMITESGKLKLTDFGIAKDLDRTALTADGRTLGTAAYMAPEQIRGTPEVSHKTDLYALGCVLFQMLTNRPPFEGKSALQLMHKHLQDPPPKPSNFGAEVPKALDKLVVELMAKARDDRPWDAQAAAQTLQTIQEKQVKGEKVALVHDDLPANPSRLGADEPGYATGDPVSTGTSARKTGGTKTKKSSRGKPTATEPRYSGDIRSRLEVAGIVLGLLLLGGFIAYQFWPASEGYLFRKAGQYMASSIRADRLRARDKYMAELDLRFPGKHQEQLRKWRDELLLEDVDRRAKFLASPALASLTNINLPVERSFAEVARSVRDDLDENRDIEAALRWRQFAETLEDDAKINEDIRAWKLYADKEAAAQQAEIERRLKDFTADMQRFSAAQLTGNRRDVDRIGREIIAKYSRYQSLERPLALLRAGLGEAPPAKLEDEPLAPMPPALTEPEPEPDPETP